MMNVNNTHCPRAKTENRAVLLPLAESMSESSEMREAQEIKAAFKAIGSK